MGYVVSPDWVIGMFSGGFLSCWLAAGSAMSGLTVSMHLVYPSLIPVSGDGVRKAYFVLSSFSEQKLTICCLC